MRALRNLAIFTIVLATLIGARPGSAAESYDGCTGFIDEIPATITIQGVWCLRQDLTSRLQTRS